METMTTKEVAAYIGVSLGTARKYVHEEGLPVLRFKGRSKWTFRKDLVDQWMASRSMPEVVDIAAEKKEEGYGRLRVLAP
ncbi:helix-turn-helix domain-containing protein [Sporosarcina sp. FSL K6-1508]|uniref:helix-turn-helix domain-containing protein n=1 Tax=Sporosarcina sp. FSL K6-1508 TaxID=2921553 RepID=UPI0030FAD3DE